MSTNLALTRFEIGPFEIRPTPAMIAGAGKPAVLRFLEFFTVNIRNKNTRAAYARAAAAQRGHASAHGCPRIHSEATPVL
jgi:hypothetical protein